MSYPIHLDFDQFVLDVLRNAWNAAVWHDPDLAWTRHPSRPSCATGEPLEKPQTLGDTEEALTGGTLTPAL